MQLQAQMRSVISMVYTTDGHWIAAYLGHQKKTGSSSWLILDSKPGIIPKATIDLMLTAIREKLDIPKALIEFCLLSWQNTLKESLFLIAGVRGSHTLYRKRSCLWEKGFLRHNRISQQKKVELNS